MQGKHYFSVYFKDKIEYIYDLWRNSSISILIWTSTALNCVAGRETWGSHEVNKNQHDLRGKAAAYTYCANWY